MEKEKQAPRKTYCSSPFLEETCAKNPFLEFSKWYQEAVEANLSQANAMTLATVSQSGKPSVRIVLLKEFIDNTFVFFTNYQSKKAKEVEANPNISLLFFWEQMNRQIRIEGTAKKLSREKNIEYFKTRPRGAQIAAAVSDQSVEIASREVLEQKFNDLEAEKSDQDLLCPEHWGGYQVIANYFEFWQGRKARLHDRICFSKSSNENWERYRLAP